MVVEPRNKGKIFPIFYYLLSYNSFTAFISKKLNKHNNVCCIVTTVHIHIHNISGNIVNNNDELQ